MRQTIQIRRVETRTLQLEVAQPLTRQTLLEMVNGQLVGMPELGAQVQHELTQWSLSRVTPECECATPKARKAR